MCSSCGSNAAPLRSLDNTSESEVTVQNLFDSGKYKLVRFVGRNFTTTIGSPTGVIVNDGLRSYGRGKGGDVLLVHVDDIQAAPTVFTVLAKGTEGYAEGMTKYGLQENETMSKITSVASQAAINKAVESVEAAEVQEVNEPNVTAETVDEEQPQEPKVTEEAPTVVETVTADVSGAKVAETVETEDVADVKGNTEISSATLSKADALPLKEFQQQYGFTHHMQVLAKVRSGELKSFKDADDNTMIYHFD